MASTTTQTQTVNTATITITTTTNGALKAKTEPKVVVGAMTLGKEGAEGARVHTLPDIIPMLDVLQQHRHNEIDTARVCGTSEALLGELKWQDRGLMVNSAC
ncbi:hypothetical protein LTR66_002422 [Elasticomyces elasticus]|nr:hypothetical protein LTR66_002422 [Elasticomyces elasticus]